MRGRSAVLERRVEPCLQCHPHQCGDQDRGVQLSNERFGYGQRPRNPIYRIRVAITQGGEGGKAEVDQAGRLTCVSTSKGRLEVDGVGDLLQQQLVTECLGHADQQVGSDAAHDPVHIDRAGKKCLLERHDHEYGHARHP